MIDLKELKNEIKSVIAMPTEYTIATIMHKTGDNDDKVLCVCCGKKVVMKQVGEGWHTTCDCEQSNNLAAKYRNLLALIKANELNLRNVEHIVEERALKIYKENYKLLKEKRDAELQEFDEQVLALETLS